MQLSSQSEPVTIAEYLLTLNTNTTISTENTSAIARITGINSNDQSIILSIKQNGGENIKQVTSNQVTSFGSLSICFENITINVQTGGVQAWLIATASEKAVAWYLIAAGDKISSCDLFKEAILSSQVQNGSEIFFSQQLSTTLSTYEFVSRSYESLTDEAPDNSKLQEGVLFVQENGPGKFISKLVGSN